MINLYYHPDWTEITTETHLFVCLWGCFLRSVTDEDRCVSSMLVLELSSGSQRDHHSTRQTLCTEEQERRGKSALSHNSEAGGNCGFPSVARIRPHNPFLLVGFKRIRAKEVKEGRGWFAAQVTPFPECIRALGQIKLFIIGGIK